MVGRFNFLKRPWPFFAFLMGSEILAWLASSLFSVPLTGPPLCLYVLIFVFNPFVLPAAEMYDPRLAKEDPHLSTEASQMAAVMEVDPLPVKVLTGSVGRQSINAFWKEKSLFVTSRAVEELSHEAVLFMIGHEVGHLRHTKDREARRKNLRWPAVH